MGANSTHIALFKILFVLLSPLEYCSNKLYSSTNWGNFSKVQEINQVREPKICNLIRGRNKKDATKYISEYIYAILSLMSAPFHLVLHLCRLTISPSDLYNLFRLFFLTSTAFFLSAWDFVAATAPFFWTAATDAPTAASVTGATVFWSCSVSPGPLDAVDEVNGAGCNVSALPLWTGLGWSTFRAVVDSDIAPVLHFGFLRAWIPVYNLREEKKKKKKQGIWYSNHHQFS